jgi:UDP-N-acetylmuramate dehydrogenase
MCPQKPVNIVESCRKNYPCEIDVRYDEPMAAHCTFKAGGPADCWLRPSGGDFSGFAAALFAAALAENIPVFVLGGGANILVADDGIRGIVLDTGGLSGEAERGLGGMVFFCGTGLDDAAEIAASAGLSGLEFFAGMPGSVGGAVWMNARCYGRDTAGVLAGTEIIDFSVSPPLFQRLPAVSAEFGYKRSPFQGRDVLILSAAFNLVPKDPALIRAEMESFRRDRESKGHYRFPSAGSVFKNDEGFGKPTGKIIDELGLRGLQIGGAQVAPWHGNMIINTGNASAADIRNLADEVAARVKTATGLVLEPEILYIGHFSC